MHARWSAVAVLLGACGRPPSEVEVHPNVPESAVVAEPPRAEEPALSIDATGVRHGQELLVSFGDDRAQGADVSQKRNGPHDLFLVPVGAWVTRERSGGRLGPSLTVVAQRETPYRALMELLFTAANSEISAFLLRESSASGRVVYTEPPRPSAPPTPEELQRMRQSPPLNLVVLILPEGIALKTASGHVAPGCREVGRGVTVPRVDGKLDLPSLVACARALKAQKPSFAQETLVTLTESPALPVGELFDVAIALAGTKEEPLFPKVQFGLAR